MEIKTNLGTIITAGAVIFIAGEVYGYLRCAVDMIRR